MSWLIVPEVIMLALCLIPISFVGLDLYANWLNLVDEFHAHGYSTRKAVLAVLLAFLITVWELPGRIWCATRHHNAVRHITRDGIVCGECGRLW